MTLTKPPTDSELDVLDVPTDDLASAVASPWFPVAVAAGYPPPKAAPDPDTSKRWWRRMLPLLYARKRLFIAAMTASLISMVAQVAVPRVMGIAIDRSLTEQTASLATFVWILIGLATVGLGAGFFYRYQLQAISAYIETDMRVIAYQHLARLSFSFYDRVQSGQLISRANSDIRAIQMFLAFAPQVMLQITTLAVALGLMMQVHAPLALISIAPLPLVYFVGVRMRRELFPISWTVQSRQADVATTTEENITGIRVVQSFAAEMQQIRQFTTDAARLRWATTRQIDVRALYGPIMENLPRVGMAIVLLYGGHLVVDGTIKVGTIVAFSTYVVMLQVPFRMMGMLMMQSQRAAASAQRIFEVLDEQPEIVDRPGAVDLVETRGEIVFDDVTFSYANGPEVLEGFDLRISPGETVAVVGRTGTGKSTVARLLLRFYDVDDGAVRIDGVDVRDLTLASLRAHIGLVSEEPFLFSETIHNNIAYARPDASRADVQRAAEAAHAAEFIDDFDDGYDEIVGERGYTLSGGQRQRIAIARTLLADPKILILDDATSAIDVKVEEYIHDALRTLMEGRSTIVIAHRLSTINLADRVALLEDGRIVATGTHAELIQNEPRYAEVLAHIEDDVTADEAARGGGR